jgi:hypothetical protein
MVELRMRKREMIGDGGNHHEKLGLREYCVWVNLPSPKRQVRVLIQWVITPICSLLNPIRQFVPLISHIHLYPPYHSHLYPPSLFLAHNSTIIAEHKAKSYLSISPCHDHEVILCTAYTQYSIHRIQHTPNTAYTQDCLTSLHSNDYKLTTECSFSFRCASLQDWPPTGSSLWELKSQVTSSHSHSCELL